MLVIKWLFTLLKHAVPSCYIILYCLRATCCYHTYGRLLAILVRWVYILIIEKNPKEHSIKSIVRFGLDHNCPHNFLLSVSVDLCYNFFALNCVYQCKIHDRHFTPSLMFAIEDTTQVEPLRHPTLGVCILTAMPTNIRPRWKWHTLTQFTRRYTQDTITIVKWFVDFVPDWSIDQNQHHLFIFSSAVNRTIFFIVAQDK